MELRFGRKRYAASVKNVLEGPVANRGHLRDLGGDRRRALGVAFHAGIGALAGRLGTVGGFPAGIVGLFLFSADLVFVLGRLRVRDVIYLFPFGPTVLEPYLYLEQAQIRIWKIENGKICFWESFGSD